VPVTPEENEDVSRPLDRAGQVVAARYLIERELRQGASGTVWQAREIGTGERVAIKVLRADVAMSPAARKRFHHEVVSTAALDHPHSVRVFDHGTAADGAEFLVMELVSGSTLSEILATSAPLPQLRAIRIAAQILDATATAHRLGMVHRDLKPDNVMLVVGDGQRDFVKVCDYGLAKLMSSGERAGDAPRLPDASFATLPGALCGTPAYMAPEQARGEDIDGRADLYAVGVMLFQMTVGRLPFEGRTPIDVVSAHLTQPVPFPRALRPDLGLAPALENIVLRAMAKDRRVRPSSAGVMRADLLQLERDLVRDEQRSAIAPAPPREGSTLPASVAVRRPHVRARRAGPLEMAGVTVVLASLALTAARSSSRTTPESSGGVSAPSVPPQGPPESSTIRPAAPATFAATAVSPLERPRAASEAHRRASVSAPSLRPSKAGAAPPSAPSAGEGAPAPDLLSKAEDALGRGRLEDARVLGLAAAEREPVRPDVWEFLGRCYMRLGRPAEARAFYARHLALAPDGPRATAIRAIVSVDADAGGAAQAE
jgi:serine/threonine-protein kinase